MVVVDTSVWIEYLRAPASGPGRALAALLERREALITGVVITEVMQGVRSGPQRTAVANHLMYMPYEDLDKDGWLHAGELSAQLRQQGLTMGIADLVIAAVALQGAHEVYTLDSDFQRIPGIKCYQPEAS